MNRTIILLALIFGLGNSIAWSAAFIAFSLNYYIFEPALLMAIIEAVISAVMVIVTAIAIRLYFKKTG